jgi:hypothetical protein
MGLRVVRRLVVGALALASLTLSAVGPAAAGGPTSVVLSLPGTGRMNVLHVTSVDYDKLAKNVGAYGAAPAAEGAAGRHDQGPVLTLTWLIHDVQPWRVDYVYLLAPGGPWIASRQTDGAGDIWNQPQVWHRSTDAAGLRKLVHELKVDPTDWTPADGGVAPEGAPADSEPLGLPSSGATAPASSTASSGAPGGSAGGGWVWGIAGLVAGAVLTVAGEWAWSRRRRGAVASADEPPAPGGGPAEVELDPVVMSGP